MRVLGVDLGARRTGLAISDPSGLIARPLGCIESPDPLEPVLREVRARLAEDEALAAIVVGLPRRLDGSPTGRTPAVLAFVEALRAAVAIPVVLQDERLSSVEAESRLARRERDWRKRKAQLDAVSAAVILQDYLDEVHRARALTGEARTDEE